MRSTKIFTLFVVALVLATAGAARLGVAASPDLSPEMQSRLDSLPDAITKIDYLRGEIAGRPDDPALRFKLGNLLFDEGQLQEASEHLSKLTKLEPGFLGGFVNLGNTYDELGQLDMALATYEQALSLAPTDEKTLCNMGGVYFKKRQIDKALAVFTSALEAHPESQLALYNMAILFADAEIYREAEREWAKAVKIDPESDLGKRSAENIKIIRQLMSAEMPVIQDSPDSHDGHDHGEGAGSH